MERRRVVGTPGEALEATSLAAVLIEGERLLETSKFLDDSLRDGIECRPRNERAGKANML